MLFLNPGASIGNRFSVVLIACPRMVLRIRQSLALFQPLARSWYRRFFIKVDKLVYAGCEKNEIRKNLYWFKILLLRIRLVVFITPNNSGKPAMYFYDLGLIF